MAIQWQNVDVRFGQGIDTKTDPLQLPAGKLSALVNGRIQKTGAITKRFGFGTLPALPDDVLTYPFPLLPVAVITHDDQLMAFNGVEGSIWTDTGAAWWPVGHPSTPGVATPRRYGFVPSITATTQQVVSDSDDWRNPDIATNGSSEFIVYERGSSAGIYCVVRDLATGTVILRGQVSSSGSGPKVFPASANRYFVVFRHGGGGAGLDYVMFDDRNPPVSMPPGATIVPECNAITNVYDATAVGDTLYITWVTSPSGWYLNIGHYNMGASLTSLSTPVAHANGGASIITALAIMPGNPSAFGGAMVFVVNAYQALGQWYVSVDATSTDLATYYGNHILEQPAAKVCHVGVTPWRGMYPFAVVYDTNSSVAGPGPDPAVNGRSVAYHTLFGLNDTHPFTPIASSTQRMRCGLTGKPIWYGGNTAQSTGQALVPCMNSSQVTATGSIMLAGDTFAGACDVAQFCVGVGGGERSLASLSETPMLTSTMFLTVSERRGNVVASDGRLTAARGIARTVVDLSDAYRYQSARLGQETIISGGVVTRWDGVDLVESGFLDYPEHLGGTASAAVGAGIPTGTYQWCFTYQWQDARGQIHESAPSAVFLANVTAGQQMAFDVSSLQRTRRSNVHIVGYRTQDLASTGDTTMYRWTQAPASVLSDRSQNYIHVVDDNTHFSTANEFIYTTGGVLENLAPPPCDRLCTHNNRVWARATDGSNLLWLSKPLVFGRPTEWSDLLFARVNERFGTISALGEMDEHLVAFTPSAIYIITGHGPSATGQGNDLGEPQLVTTDVGCNNPDSVVRVPTGLMFESGKGIYLLDRTMQVSFVGAPVEDYTSPVTSAALMPETSEVRFTTATETLVYNYLYDQWSVFNLPAVDQVVWRGTPTYVSPDGRIHPERSGYADVDGSGVLTGPSLSLTTGWLPFAGLQGYQRARDMLVLANATMNSSPPTVIGTVDLGPGPVLGWGALVGKTLVVVETIPGVATNSTTITIPSLVHDVTDLVFVLNSSGLASTFDTVVIGGHTYGRFYVDPLLGWYTLQILEGTGAAAMLGFAGEPGAGSVAAHTITVETAYDYVDTFSPAQVFDSNNVQTGLEQFRVFLGQPRCEAVKVRLTVSPKAPPYDASTSSATPAVDLLPCTMTGLSFTVGAKRGHAKTPATRQIGT